MQIFCKNIKIIVLCEPMKPLITHTELLRLLAYDPKTGVFTEKTYRRKRKPGDAPGGKSPQGYWYIGVAGRQYPAHRLAWFYVYGVWPTNQIDHVNNNRLDNRISNLRSVDRSTNLHNTTYTRSKHGVRGVHLVSPSKRKRTKKHWRASICIAKKRVHLGQFYTFEEAVAARKAAEKQYLL